MTTKPTSSAADVTALTDRVEQVKEDLALAVSEASDPRGVEDVRRRFLAKKGEIPLLFRELGRLPPDDRRRAGKALNELRELADRLVAERQLLLTSHSEDRRADAIDVTLPGLRTCVARPHPITQTMEDLAQVFGRLGYSFEEYPEVEDEFYNFDALNTPEWHPARDMHDTFYVDTGQVLRTHTSAFQARAMRAVGEPPLREITTGRCYRKDEMDATHSPVFHQFDGIAISEEACLGELKWTLYQMARELFGATTRVRFRPSYFPFTTPSAEMDVSCALCGGDGCRVCSQTGWVEILGCGMMHPNVLRSGHVDTSRFRGFAFGMGVDRIAMLRWGIDDIRLFFQDDLYFLNQF